MIIGGRKTSVSVPVAFAGSREKLSVELNGTVWVTAKDFTCYTYLSEIIVIIPELSEGSSVYIGIFDEDHIIDGRERWNYEAIWGKSAYTFRVDAVIVPGNLLRVKKSDAGTEEIELILYKIGL